jgi:hypothetical protein
MRQFRSAFLVAGMAAALLGGPLLANDPPRSVKLARKAHAVGDRFRAETSSSVERSAPGGPAEEQVSTRVSYTCSLLGKSSATGRFEARLELDPEETTFLEDGVARKTTGPARVVTTELAESEIDVIPRSSGAAAAGADILAGRAEAKLGETWTASKEIPLGDVMLVPVESTYRVVSIEKTKAGRELVRVELSTTGEKTVPANGVRMRILGQGHAIIDPTRADRPVEVRLAYRFIAEGGAGEDVETRSEIVVRTTDLAPSTYKGELVK